MCPWVEDEIRLHQISGKDDSSEKVGELTDSPTSGAVGGMFQCAPKRPSAHALIEDLQCTEVYYSDFFITLSASKILSIKLRN